LRVVVVLRLFAAAREAAGTGRDALPGATVGEVLVAARSRYGAAFSDVLDTAKVWRNGEPCNDEDAVDDGDEVAVLPPVSGGCG
jgi:molybdopterin converting factor small subunit